jgi:hypothetical protein
MHIVGKTFLLAFVLSQMCYLNFIVRLKVSFWVLAWQYCFLKLHMNHAHVQLDGFCCDSAASGIPGGEWVEVWVVQTPPKLHSFDKGELNSQFHGIYIRNNLIRIRVSLICKLSGTPE